MASYDNGLDDLRVIRCGNVSCSGSGTATTGGIEGGSQNTPLQNAYIQNIKTYDPYNPFTISTNGAERLRITPDGQAIFKSELANGFQIQNSTGVSQLNFNTTASILTLSPTGPTYKGGADSNGTANGGGGSVTAARRG